MSKKLIAFDLDGTLAASKQALSDEMATAIAALLVVADVAVISGGDWPQFEKQFVCRLPKSARLERLWLMPTTGGKLWRHDGDSWHEIYAELFPEAEKQKIREAFDAALAAANFSDPQIWGERLEDRGSEFTFSGLGQDAPPEEKAKWDPDHKKRLALQADLEKRLPGISIRLGGSSSIDVTRQGVDKAYALRRLSEESGLAISEMIFLGDAIYEGGNDQPALKSGVDAIPVRDPQETGTAIAAIIACLKPAA